MKKTEVTIYYTKGRTCYKLKRETHEEFIIFLNEHFDEIKERFTSFIEKKSKFPIYVFSDEEFAKVTKCLKLKEDRVYLYYESTQMKLCGFQNESGYNQTIKQIAKLTPEEQKKIDFTYIKNFSY